MNLSEWSVKNRVAVNLFCVVLLVAGTMMATLRLQRDLFPDVDTNFISVTTIDPQTSIPEDIERTITVPIEEELTDVEGVKELVAFSQDNISTIFLELEAEITDVNPILDEVRQAVDKAQADLPTEAEPPIVEKFDIPFPLITFAVVLPPGYDIKSVRPVLDRIERKLRTVRGVSDVLVDGLEEREVWAEIDPLALQASGLSFRQVADAVARRNLNVAGGRLDGAGGQRLVRVLGEIDQAEDLETLALRESQDGGVLFLRDLATVKETSEEATTYGRLNMSPSVTYTVIKRRGADAIQTTTDARKVFEKESESLPEGLETLAVSDSTKYINTRIETVLRNGFQAVILVTILLMLLLNWRLAFFVALGIPISFAGTMVVLYLTGNTLNLLSLFAMIMALGMVVDDAVVVAENVYRLMQKGLTPVQAAIRGAQEVAWPVLGSVSTTVAAFLPLIWGEGIIGKFLAVVPVVVIATLVFSLVQAFLVLPSHLADFCRIGKTPQEVVESRRPGIISGILFQIRLTYAEMREVVDLWMRRVIEIYLHALTMTLRWRYFLVGGALALFLAVVGAVAAGVVPFRLFSTDFADTVIVKLELPPNSSLQQTRDAVADVEERIAEVLPETDLVALVTRVGARLDPTDQFLEYGTNVAMITVDIDEQNPESRKPSAIERDLRSVLREFPQFINATAKAEEGGPPVGRAINIEISGPEYAELRAIATKVEEYLAQQTGVTDIGNDFPRGKTEFRVRLNEAEAARADLSVAQVADALTAGFRGIEARKIRWGNDEVTLRVKMDERFSNDPEMVMGFRIMNGRGQPIDIASIATIERTSGFSRIKRLDRERAITVAADVDERATTSADVNTELKEFLPGLFEEFPGYNFKLTGENEDSERSVNSMIQAAGIALLLIYALLATITNSFAQPLVIMMVIPYGLVGVILGLIFQGQSLGLMSMMGTVALAGIVVNNAVVLVDFINRYRHEALEGPSDSQNARHQPGLVTGFVRWRSILLTGKIRFRPIFLTTATTIAGLWSLAFLSTGQEQFLAPMAQAIIWGLAFATLITLLLIPALYAVLDDIRNALTGSVRKLTHAEESELETTPAK